MAIVYLGLGSNLGNGRENLLQAIELIQEQIGEVIAQSAFIESEPWGFVSDYRFTNAAIAIQTNLLPLPLLQATQAIEKQMGRTHKHKLGEPYQDRIIDIDILDYEGMRFHSDVLELPHPHIADRDFVRIPLQECRQKVTSQAKNINQP